MKRNFLLKILSSLVRKALVSTKQNFKGLMMRCLTQNLNLQQSIFNQRNIVSLPLCLISKAHSYLRCQFLTPSFFNLKTDLSVSNNVKSTYFWEDSLEDGFWTKHLVCKSSPP
ncbi:hypothetical protein EGW08_011535 [Elysia chlorotica]|uniref:Uncharacterized protein n=1 Tax=Elysia chlorotica TaxID=188477 RepID=A0A3S1BHA5_ELYCH|nr:hypothetical protein EGW08_011535 [Elysia chlorotica]